MFCTNCGQQQTKGDSFCGKCGNQLNTNIQETQERIVSHKVSEKQESDLVTLKSSRSKDEILGKAKTVAIEYAVKPKLVKATTTNKFDKERVTEVWDQKAIARFESSGREICFAENAFLAMTIPGFGQRSIASALRRSEIEYIVVSKHQNNFRLPTGSSSKLFLQLRFITKWAGINKEIPSNMKSSPGNSGLGKVKDGEFDFLLTLGNSNHQTKEYEELYWAKIDAIAAFYPIFSSDTVSVDEMSIGATFGTGFWREIGE